MVDQTCNEGNCADEDCDGEKAAYVAALKKRIHLLLRLNRTFVRGWTQAALKSGLKRFRSERLRPSPISKIRRNKLIVGDVGISPCQRRRNTGIAPKNV